MQGTLIAPDSTGALGPVHPRNAVVVPGYQTHHVIPDQLVLVRGYSIDSANMQADTRKDRLPARDGMRANDWVGGAELVIHIQGGAPRRHDVVPAGLAGGLEHGLGTSCGQRLEEGAEGRRKPVIDLVARYPEGVAAGGRGGLHTEEREV